ncbi:MAG TPA: ferritin-like domain-containing protein [Candidatus Binataceae bacterium]|nr:ferritin-like domain-containing protein [Candidatus Binataceae bacterium]
MAEMMEKVKDYTTSANIKRPLLMEKLSEFLAVEKGGVKLYEAAIQQVRNPDVLNRFREFYQQTRRHVEILTRIISSLGGDPMHMSPGAKVAEEKAEALLKTMTLSDGMRPDEAEINAIENIVIAETKDHADWQLLSHIARRSSDSQLRDILKPAVDEVEPQEDDHLNWSKQQMAQMALATLCE